MVNTILVETPTADAIFRTDKDGKVDMRFWTGSMASSRFWLFFFGLGGIWPTAPVFSNVLMMSCMLELDGTCLIL